MSELYYCPIAKVHCNTRERPHGEWIRKTDGLPHFVVLEWFICSECGVQKPEPTPFCPNCGARMKEGDEK